MRSMSRRAAFLVALIVACSALAVPAIAKRGENRGEGSGKTRPAVTKMRFKLDSHQWDVGAEITGVVTLLTRDGKSWAPLEGASLTVTNDDVECGTITTDAEGKAYPACGPATEGEHVIKVRYAGDEGHKKSQRAQGYEAGGTEGDEDTEEEEVLPTPEPSPTI